MTTDSTTTTPTRRILVIDDNEDALLILRLLLQTMGYPAQVCTSGQQALQLTETNRYDLVLLDISMPGMDGYETCRRLRQQPDGPQLMIVALTGYGQREDIERTREAGFDDHLLKPVDLAALTRLLNTN